MLINSGSAPVPPRVVAAFGEEIRQIDLPSGRGNVRALSVDRNGTVATVHAVWAEQGRIVDESYDVLAFHDGNSWHEERLPEQCEVKALVHDGLDRALVICMNDNPFVLLRRPEGFSRWPFPCFGEIGPVAMTQDGRIAIACNGLYDWPFRGSVVFARFR